MFRFAHRQSFHRTILTYGQGLCLLLVCVFGSGCVNLGKIPNRPPQTTAQQAPLDAYALSGGKITRFIGDPYLPNDPAAKALLKACQGLPETSYTAQSVYVMIKYKSKINPIPGLRVGNMTLILVGSVERMLTSGIDSKTAAILTLKGGTRRAKIGNQWVHLQKPVIAVDGGQQTVMTLPDLLALFQAADQQRGSHEIQYVKTQYDLNPNLLYKSESMPYTIP